MTDLVTRLRKIGATDPFGFNTMIAAADEIERLELRVAELELALDFAEQELEEKNLGE